jgi:hypothetical protein
MDQKLRILSIFRNSFKSLTFSEILEKSTLTRQPTYRQLKQLVEYRIINKQRIANIDIYSLNMSLAAPLLSFIDKKETLKNENLKKLNFVLSNNVWVKFALLTDKKLLIIIDENSSKEIKNEVISNLRKHKENFSVELIEFNKFKSRVYNKEKLLLNMLKKSVTLVNGEKYYLEIKSLFEGLFNEK